jgi:uncharacterized protein (UPF0548 family)
MILLNKPSKQEIDEFILGLKEQQLTYSPAGMTKDIGLVPQGYVVDHNRIRLGEGASAFKQAIKALNNWQHFNLGWLNVSDPNTAIETGMQIGLLCSFASVWLLCACRVVYVVNEDGPVKKYGFAYGTLPGHPETGEERFTIEWHDADNSVWYDLLAFSKPGNLLVTIGYPLTRALQKKFVKDSQRAMLDAVRSRN